MVLPRIGKAVVAEISERLPERFVEAADRPVIAGDVAPRIIAARVRDIGLHAGAVQRAAVVVSGNESHPPGAAAPRHHVAGRDHQPVADESAGAAVTLVVEDPADQAPGPGGVVKLPAVVVAEHPQRPDPPTAEPPHRQRLREQAAPRREEDVRPFGPEAGDRGVFVRALQECGRRPALGTDSGDGAAEARIDGGVNAPHLTVADGRARDADVRLLAARSLDVPGAAARHFEQLAGTLPATENGSARSHLLETVRSISVAKKRMLSHRVLPCVVNTNALRTLAPRI